MSKTLEQKADQLFQEGKDQEAYQIYLNIRAQSQNKASIDVKLSRCLMNMNKPTEALRILSKLVDLNPPIWEARIRFIFCVNLLGKSIEAEQLLKKIPVPHLKELDKLSALKTAIAVYSDLGEREKVVLLAKDVLSIREDSYNSLMQYFVHCKPEDYDKKIIDKYELIAQKTKGVSFPANKEVDKLFYALAHAHDAMGNYKDSVKHLKRASAIHSYNEKFENNYFENLREKAKTLIDKNFYAERKDWAESSNKAIFVVGMPRSSTSLVEQILSSHSRVFGGGELQIVNNIIAGLQKDLSQNQGYIDIVDKADAKKIKELGNYFIETIDKFSGNAEFVIDKMPLNAIHLGLIHLILPNSKIIHCVRDLRDVAISIYTKRFTTGNEWAQSFENIAYMMQIYIDLMKHWKSIFSDKIYNCSYEKLIENQEKEIKNLISYCGLDWENNCLEFYKTKRAVQTASNSQVKQPVFKSSLGRWKNYEPYFGKELKKIGELNDELLKSISAN